jgi:hypothetical protein
LSDVSSALAFVRIVGRSRTTNDARTATTPIGVVLYLDSAILRLVFCSSGWHQRRTAPIAPVVCLLAMGLVAQVTS